MEVVRDIGAFDAPHRGLAVTIGAYDGLHLGHRRLISELQTRASADGIPTAVVTFDRHPASVVRPASAPLLLTDPDLRLELIAETGVDYLVLLAFDEKRSQESAEDFVDEVLVSALRTKLVVVGADFHFGRERKGTVGLLREMGATLGFEAIGVELTSTEDGEVLSSSRVRRALGEGRIDEVTRLLGRFHEVRGVVEHGDARGAALLGCPTANVSVAAEIMLARVGIYAGWYRRESGSVHPCAISVGMRPTFLPDVALHAGPSSGQAPILEAHLIDFSGNLYGETARVAFVERIRDEVRFASTAELSERIKLDIAAAREILSRARTPWAC